MKLAYLVNQYPQLSHSFIRREIQAIENGGQPVERISIRPVGICIDAEDQLEAPKTWSILNAGMLHAIASVAIIAFTRPVQWVKALCKAVTIGWRSNNSTFKHLIYLAEACVLLRRTTDRGIDHIHAHFGTNSATVAMLTRLLGGPSYSFTIHGPEEFDRPEALAIREKVALASFVVAISEYGRSQIFRWIETKDWSKVQVVRCGVDRAFLEAPLVAVPQNARFVCVGRLCEQKGQLILVRAIAQLREKHVYCEADLIGDGPMRQEIAAEIARLDLADRVFLRGPLSGADVRREVLSGRAFVLPSFAEGLPVVIMEALALRRPVISTFVAGIPELVETWSCGWTIPAGSVSSLANAMQEALDSTISDLQLMGNQGHLRVSRMHSSEIEGKKLLQIFHSVCGVIEASLDAPSTLPSLELAQGVA